MTDDPAASSAITADATSSWWLQHLPLDLAPPASTALPATADVLIVGAGMTGCATAYWLQKAASRGQGHTQGTHITDMTQSQTKRAYVISFRDHFGQGRDVRATVGTRMYCQGGDSDGATLRAMVSVAAPLGNRPKMASAAPPGCGLTQESGISFGRFCWTPRCASVWDGVRADR